MPIADFFRLMGRALARAFDDNCFSLAKGAAFSWILSFFPGLIVVASLLFSSDAEGTLREISAALGAVLPEQSYRLAAGYLTAEGRTTGLLAGAWVVAIWSACDAVGTLMAGFRAAYRLPNSWSFLKTQAVALALVLLAGIPLLAATLLLFFGQQIENWLLMRLGILSDWILLAGRASRWMVAMATSVAVLATVYHFAPGRRQRWRYVWPGAVLATALWLAATVLFAWYAQNVARYGDLYGGIAAAVVLLVWLYLVSLAVLVGCEFNAEYERAAGAPQAGS